jgi:hypothetical protein
MSIPEYAGAKFNRLLRAAISSDLALIECADIVTGEPCPCHRDRDDTDHALRSPRARQCPWGL